MAISKRKTRRGVCYQVELYLGGKRVTTRSFRNYELAKAWHDVQKRSHRLAQLGLLNEGEEDTMNGPVDEQYQPMPMSAEHARAIATQTGPRFVTTALEIIAKSAHQGAFRCKVFMPAGWFTYVGAKLTDLGYKVSFNVAGKSTRDKGEHLTISWEDK